jgi:hypothetical protein
MQVDILPKEQVRKGYYILKPYRAVIKKKILL